MNDRTILIEVTRRRFQGALALLLMVLAVPELGSESATFSTSYPAPSGFYARIVTTGGSPARPRDTLLARDRGSVLIGMTSPGSAAKLGVAGGIHASDDVCVPGVPKDICLKGQARKIAGDEPSRTQTGIKVSPPSGNVYTASSDVDAPNGYLQKRVGFICPPGQAKIYPDGIRGCPCPNGRGIYEIQANGSRLCL